MIHSPIEANPRLNRSILPLQSLTQSSIFNQRIFIAQRLFIAELITLTSPAT